MSAGGDQHDAPAVSGLARQLDRLGDAARAHLAAAHDGREEALRACRATIRSCGSAIRAVHRHDGPAAAELRSEAGRALGQAQAALAPFPRLAAAGFLHDAEKEYAEAHLTAALVDIGNFLHELRNVRAVQQANLQYVLEEGGLHGESRQALEEAITAQKEENQLVAAAIERLRR
ncbi:MAG: hypothetical protein M0007_09790 [Actinomycetota bacterium]|nr:hypothetical protein [Actinomycetota bacterium]